MLSQLLSAVQALPISAAISPLSWAIVSSYLDRMLELSHNKQCPEQSVVPVCLPPPPPPSLLPFLFSSFRLLTLAACLPVCVPWPFAAVAGFGSELDIKGLADSASPDDYF